MDYCLLCRTQSRPLKKDLLIFQCNKRRKVLGKDFLYRKERGESKKVLKPKALKIIMTKNVFSLFREKVSSYTIYIS